MLMFLFATEMPVSPPTLPSCHVEQVGPISFSGGPEPDRLLVAVHGDPCWDGIARISITSATGALLYEHEQRFKPLTASHWEDPELPADAERFVNDTIKDGLKLFVLPAWLPPDEYYEEYISNVVVSREYYEYLVQRKLPVFSHNTYYEGGVSLVYDPDRKTVLTVSEWGL